MPGLLVRRGRDLVIVLFLVGTAMFLLLHLIPGSPAIAILGPSATREQIDALNSELGLDRPLLEQYLTWIGHAVRGDLGYSVSQGGGVGEAVLRYLGPTMMLALSATALAVVISVPLAVRTVAKPRAFSTRLLMGASSLGLAVPTFWLALILILFLAVKAPIFPVSGYVSPTRDLGEAIRHLTLPVAVILAHQVALFVVTLRESLAGELLNPYIRTARSKGSVERRVMYRHLLPNALLPAITVVGSTFGAMLGGVIIIETVFLVPGIGYLLYNAIQSRDYNLILGITLITAVIIVLVNLIVDVMYAVLDPRVRLS